jgi:protein-tyrosine-phosphatase
MTAELDGEWRVLFAGTEPDEELAAGVVALLEEEGLAVPGERPHRVTGEELAAADWLVSMGCDLSELDVGETAVLQWDDVPPTSAGVEAARSVIVEHLERFLGGL